MEDKVNKVFVVLPSDLAGEFASYSQSLKATNYLGQANHGITTIATGNNTQGSLPTYSPFFHSQSGFGTPRAFIQPAPLL